MIPTGLKVGQTYKYYGLTYKVLKVVGDNYVSERVQETAPLAPVEPETKEVTEVTDYESMQYAQLKKLCAERGLDAKGSKADLISRLEG